jgi:TolB-like protein/Flp pilus assembly protein TadD
MRQTAKKKQGLNYPKLLYNGAFRIGNGVILTAIKSCQVHVLSLFAELKRRNVFRVAIAYVAISWLLIQVVETVFPVYGISDTAIRFVITVLAIGFIPVLVFAWVFELTSAGLKRDSEVDHTDSASIAGGRKFDRVILVVLALALGYFAFDKFVLDPARTVELVEKATEQALTQARLDSFGDKSIAVLPFVNMSADPEQEYFADGIAEELLNLLVHVDGLRVISRTSAFQFKGSELSLGEIAEALDVAHILEGSVRRSGDRIRITTQLIDARADTHVWSETYDRGMEDIFAIQDEVAAQVVEQLRVAMSVGLDPVERHNSQAYPLYLQAKHLLGGAEPERLDRVEQLLLQALEIDPGYLDAKVDLAWVYTNRGDAAYEFGDFELAEQRWERAEQILQEVAAVDDDNVQLNLARAWGNMRDTATAARYIERALGTDPNNARALNTAMVLMMRLWRNDSARIIGEYTVRRDPLDTHAQWNLTRAYLNAGEFELAEGTARTMVTLRPDSIGFRWFIGLALLLQGNSESALKYFQQIGDEGKEVRLQGLAMALHDLGRYDESGAALTDLIKIENAKPKEELPWFHGIAIVYMWTGDTDKAFEYLEQTRLHTSGALRVAAQSPFYSRIEDDPRWLPFLESAGLAPQQLNAIEFNPRLPVEIRAAINNKEQADGQKD